jgi:FLAGELLAR PROTEIN G FLAG
MNVSDFETNNFRFVNYVSLSHEQSHLIWQGRNHPEIRKWMTNPNPFTFDEHEQFVKKLKMRNDCIFWAVLFKDEIVGSYCLNPYNSILKEGEMGKFILPDYLGRGIGSLMTKEFVELLLHSDMVNRIYAKIKVDNIRNQHLNLKIGFHVYSCDEEYVYMEIRKEDIGL